MGNCLRNKEIDAIEFWLDDIKPFDLLVFYTGEDTGETAISHIEIVIDRSRCVLLPYFAPATVPRAHPYRETICKYLRGSGINVGLCRLTDTTDRYWGNFITEVYEDANLLMQDPRQPPVNTTLTWVSAI